jgi:hypothetical protein
MFRALVLTVFLAAASQAQSQPDFSGTWKLNVSKSDFGPVPAPDTRTDVIEQSADGIKDKVSASGQQGKQDYTLSFKTDGTETVNKIGEREAKVSAKWDGPALVVSTKLAINDMQIDLKANWTLSADGATLTQAVHLSTPMGEADQKVVYEKQTGTRP